jgi:DNA-binding NarL/FixJ family response regulator
MRQQKPKLTPRERQVLALLCWGDPLKVVAFKLQISERTAEAHKANIKAKMGASGKSAEWLGVQALRLRLVS